MTSQPNMQGRTLDFFPKKKKVNLRPLLPQQQTRLLNSVVLTYRFALIYKCASGHLQGCSAVHRQECCKMCRRVPSVQHHPIHILRKAAYFRHKTHRTKCSRRDQELRKKKCKHKRDNWIELDLIAQN